MLSSITAGLGALVPAASPSPEPQIRYVDPQTVSPGLLGLLIFVLLGVATVLLWLNMNKQLKKIDLPDDQDSDGERRIVVPTREPDSD